MKRNSANDTTAEGSTPNAGAQGGKMDVRGWDASSPPAPSGNGELAPDKQGAVAQILGECETSGGSVTSGPHRSSSHSAKDVISFVHTGSDVTDVIRSGIVSRILASVSGREADYSSAGLELHSSPSQPRSPSRFKTSSLRAKPEFADVVLDTMKEKRKLQTQKVFPKANPKSQKFDLDSSVGESSTSAGRVTRVHSSPHSQSATTTLSENSPSAEPVRGAAEGYCKETHISKGASLSGEERKSERLTSIHLGSGQRSDRKHLGRHVTTLDVNSKTNKTVAHPAKSQVKPLRSGHVSGESVVHTQSSSSSDKKRNTSSVRAKQKPSSEIPQSMSTDSGIGSPTDVTGGVELIGNTEGVVNRMGRGETPEDSSSMQLVSPVPSHKSPNYPPCGDPSDCYPSSNYHSLLAASGWSSFPGTQRGADDSNSGGVDPVVDDVTSGVSGPGDSLHRDNCDKSQPLVNTDLPCSRHHSDSSTVGASSAPVHPPNISLQPEVNDIPPPFTSPESGTTSSRDATPNNDTDAQINGIKTHTSRRYSRPSITETNLELVADLIHDDTVAGFAVNAFLKTILNNQTHGNRIHGSEDLNPQTGLNADKTTDSVDQVEDGGPDWRVEFHPEATGVDKIAPEKPVRKCPTLRDVNLREVISLTEESPSTDRKLKGILKSTSVPTLSSTREVNTVRNGAVRPDLVNSRSVSFNKLHTKNTFSYYNAAFEGEIITEPSKRPSLADVVSHIMRQGSIVEMEDDNSHPYGRDTSLTDLITGKRRDSYNMDAGKMIVWLVLAIMIVSLAGGIIFMSETYNMNHKNDDISTTVETTTLTRLYR
ncbi:unnamed protein product [Lymnaea stagnalis]|uniref:Uncharacterized protein n=1 Tax=Lymnaea stagnalis TaxID=6523 RepID=A0AAV2I1X7_LYMST